MERLQKVIAASGYTSRRKAEDLIVQGKVEVNGQVVRELGTKVKKGDIVTVEGQAIVGENKVYYVFYKPKGCVCTLDDEFDRPIVTDYFTDVKERICLLYTSTTRYGWNFDNFIKEADAGKGLKFPKWTKNYLKYILPCIIIILFIQGYYMTFIK